MPMKLYASPANYKTKKALICAKFVGLEVESPKSSGDDKGRIPVLETEKGCIFSSMAIARYISRISRPIGLYGQNLLESGMIDSWCEFCTNELEIPLCTWVLPAMGEMPEVPEATQLAKEDAQRAMTILDKHLLNNTYMVGHTITLADISVCCALVDGMQKVFDEDFRKKFANLMRWFNTCTALAEFKSVLGEVKLCAKAGGAKGGKDKAAPKEKAAPKDKAAPKEKAAPKDKAAPKEKAEKPAPKEKAAAKEKAGKKEKGKEEKAPDAEEKKELTPEELEKQRRDKLKKVIKEGGKRGVEIEGAADMGGLQFFCTAVDLPEGDIDLLMTSMEAMNAKSDPGEEERKGGSGHIGKMLFSVGVEHLAVCAYVPEAKQAELSCKEWLETVLKSQGGEVVSTSDTVCTGKVKTDSDKGVFPLKIREPMILEANNFLRKKGLFPDNDDDDDDEYVFGDDDFPA